MPSSRIQVLSVFSISVLVAILASLCGPLEAQKEPEFKLQVKSNLVVVRVVVRDARGRPVEGLKKEDFKLFDQGKEQSISQFEVEASAAPSLSPVVAPIPGQASPPRAVQLAMPGKFLALYFDDLNTSDAEMMVARCGRSLPRFESPAQGGSPPARLRKDGDRLYRRPEADT